MNKSPSARGWVAISLGVVTTALGAAKLVASAMMGQSAFMEFKPTYTGEPLYFFCLVAVWMLVTVSGLGLVADGVKVLLKRASS
jgi:hypothetical protein